MTFKLAITSLAALMTAGAGASAQQDGPTAESTDLGDGIHMISTGMAGNLALLVGEDGAILVDDQLPNTGPLIEGAVVEIAGDAPRFVVNTHWHGDHTGGNAHFAQLGATIAAHHNIRTRIEESDNEWTQAPGALPILTFGDDLTFHMNGQTVQVIHVPSAHTDGDALVYFREADILHTGDTLFSGLYPFIDLNSGGTVDGYIAAMERGMEIAGPDTRIIPGHGPLSTPADLQASIDMVRDAQGRIAPMVAQGMSLEEVLEANPLADLDADWSWGFINTERFTTALYNDASRDE